MSKTLIGLLSFAALVAVVALALVVYKSFQPVDTPEAIQGSSPSATEEGLPSPTAAADAVRLRAGSPKAETLPAPTWNPGPPRDESIPVDPANPQSGLAMNMGKTNMNLKYRLPSSLLAQRLSGAVDPTLRLSDAQARSVAEIDAEMKAQMDANLGPIWKARELLRVQMGSFARKGDTESLANARRHYSQEIDKETAYRLLVNEEYVKRLGAILNADQMQYFSGALTPDMHARLYGAPIEAADQGYADPRLTDPTDARLRQHEAVGVDATIP